MSTGSKKKRRIDRVTSVELPPGVLGQSRGAAAPRPCVGAIGAVRGSRPLLLWGNHTRLGPALPYHRGDVPRRDIVARTQFEREDLEATRKAQELARSLAIATYDQDPARLEQLRAKLRTR